jgi:hypothetical protein
MAPACSGCLGGGLLPAGCCCLRLKLQGQIFSFTSIPLPHFVDRHDFGWMKDDHGVREGNVNVGVVNNYGIDGIDSFIG